MLSNTQSRIYQYFAPLEFNEEKHWYFLEGEYLPSVTGLVKRHYPQFNKDEQVLTRNGYRSLISLSAAKASREEKREVTEHELNKKWQDISIGAAELGTRAHKFMERYTGIETPTTPQEEAGVKYIKSLKGQYKISFRELRAFSRKYKYAGTMDLPIQIVGKDEYIIDDYKTNGDLFKAYKMMYPPFDYLEASPYNAYQLQLSYYKIMLEEAKMNIVGTRVVHLKADGTYSIYPLWDYTKELREYMKYNKAA